jgi:hypothetical protein
MDVQHGFDYLGLQGQCQQGNGCGSGYPQFSAMSCCPLCLQDPQQAVGITLRCAAHMVVVDPVLEEATLHQVGNRRGNAAAAAAVVPSAACTLHAASSV